MLDSARFIVYSAAVLLSVGSVFQAGAQRAAVPVWQLRRGTIRVAHGLTTAF
jgi:hypothetical protein